MLTVILQVMLPILTGLTLATIAWLLGYGIRLMYNIIRGDW